MTSFARARFAFLILLLAGCGGDGDGNGATGPVDRPAQTRVAFVRSVSYGEPARLIISEIGAAEVRIISPDGEAVGAFSWAPDGRHLQLCPGRRLHPHGHGPALRGARRLGRLAR